MDDGFGLPQFFASPRYGVGHSLGAYQPMAPASDMGGFMPSMCIPQSASDMAHAGTAFTRIDRLSQFSAISVGQGVWGLGNNTYLVARQINGSHARQWISGAAVRTIASAPSRDHWAPVGNGAGVAIIQHGRSTDANTFERSTNFGLTWTEVAMSGPPSTQWQARSWLSGKRYAIASNVSSSTMWYTDDNGASWQSATLPFAMAVRGFVSLPGGATLAYGSASELRTPVSFDLGATWSIPNVQLPVLPTTACYICAFENRKLYFSGSATSPALYYSDGLFGQWKPCVIEPPGASGVLSPPVCVNGVFVAPFYPGPALNNTYIMLSQDGVTWRRNGVHLPGRWLTTCVMGTGIVLRRVDVADFPCLLQ